MDLIALKSRSKASTWQLEAIALGCLWILLLRRAPRNHRHGSLRRLLLGMFVDLIVPKNRWKRSTWQLEAIAAGVVCGSYYSEEPLESIDLAA